MFSIWIRPRMEDRSIKFSERLLSVGNCLEYVCVGSYHGGFAVAGFDGFVALLVVVLFVPFSGAVLVVAPGTSCVADDAGSFYSLSSGKIEVLPDTLFLSFVFRSLLLLLLLLTSFDDSNDVDSFVEFSFLDDATLVDFSI